jgi:hypothetical protein
MEKVHINLSELPKDYDYSKIKSVRVTRYTKSKGGCDYRILKDFQFNAGDFNRLFNLIVDKVTQVIEAECNATNEAFSVMLEVVTTIQYDPVRRIKVSKNTIIQDNLLFNVDKQFAKE